MSVKTPKLTINGNWTQFVPVLRRLQDFTTHGSLHGVSRGSHFNGQLDPIYANSVGNADYTVFSYRTPIAWFVRDARHLSPEGTDSRIEIVEGGYWVIPNDKYSVTTSKSQGRIRAAVSVINNPAY